jgi:hypothetical protein
MLSAFERKLQSVVNQLQHLERMMTRRVVETNVDPAGTTMRGFYMKSNQISILVGVIALGLMSPVALAADPTNSYSDINTPAARRAVVLEETRATQTIRLEGANNSQTQIEKIVSSPVLIQRAEASPILIEDRIVKQKHLFALGIWPLFDFEVK